MDSGRAGGKLVVEVSRASCGERPAIAASRLPLHARADTFPPWPIKH
jgi:hypothetical protein